MPSPSGGRSPSSRGRSPQSARRPADRYLFGVAQEAKVARALQAKGATVHRSPGSRGAADLSARFPSGTKWKVQVKASSQGRPASPSKRDLGRLKQVATKSHATPVVAKVTPKKTSYSSARSGRPLKPPTRRAR